jgi:endonuclease-3
MADKAKVLNVIQLLQQEYGSRQREGNEEAISVLIGTILSQNTSDLNSKRAFESLRADFDSWEAILSAETESIAESIKIGGLARVKARRIKFALEAIWQSRGSFDLEFLKSLPLSQAKAWLKELPGVGPKTAGCVLLFSFDRPALPVDTHVFRVARRLGLIDSEVSIGKAHEILENQVPPTDIRQFHLNMIEHGRQVCRAQKPQCEQCILRNLCLKVIRATKKL